MRETAQHIVLALSDSLRGTTTSGQAWTLCLHAYEKLGVDGIGYGYIPLETEFNHRTATDVTIFRHSHPKTWADAIGDRDLLDADFTLPPLLKGESEIRWHHEPAHLLQAEIEQNRTDYQTQWEIDRQHGMHVGITLLLGRMSGQNGLVSSGVGLRTSTIAEQEFEKYWEHHGDYLKQISALLDAQFRVQAPNALIKLDQFEIDCLNFAAAGLYNQEIAFRLRKSEDQIKKCFARSRKKLSALTRDHAVAKALSIGLLAP